MAKEAKLKCLRCGCEYTLAVSEETDERTCPRCRSNSVRQIKEEKDGPRHNSLESR
jgi:DNA-directed RNA polymerase subunit RPC12/RpoP